MINLWFKVHVETGARGKVAASVILYSGASSVLYNLHLLLSIDGTVFGFCSFITKLNLLNSKTSKYLLAPLVSQTTI